MPSKIQLLPTPHNVTRGKGRFVLPANRAIPGELIRQIHDESLFPNSPADIRDQAYHLTITPDGITIRSRAPAGTFYALQTLQQLIRHSAFQKGKGTSSRRVALPCVHIEDRPDFARRGVYLDTARGKVPKLKTVLQLIDDLAHLKFNELQLYIENNYQFRRHPEMYNDTDPFTADELQQMDAACRARHIDFIPSLTSLGHFEKILSRPKYRALAEAEPVQLRNTDIPPAWAEQAPWSLCVTDPGSKRLIREMYDEFLPNFSSRQFNICCDETFDLGRGRSAKRAAKIGRGQLYVDWINYCAKLARAHGKSVQLWGDIILNHPELVPKLPKDAAILEWGYEADHPFDEHCAMFRRQSRDSARELYVCPGTSSWLTFSARTKNAFANIHNAATAGLKHGARGLLVTDWGDRGHQQMLAVSLTPLAYAAAASWNLAATPRVGESTLPAFLHSVSTHLFHDKTRRIAALAYDLGLVYERLKCHRANASVDWFLFREKWETADFAPRTPLQALVNVVKKTRSLRKEFDSVDLSHPDADLILSEFSFTCDEILHTCRRTLLRQAWLKRDAWKANTGVHEYFHQCTSGQRDVNSALATWFQQLWLARNKNSRLEDVTAEFKRIGEEYQKFGRATR